MYLKGKGNLKYVMYFRSLSWSWLVVLCFQDELVSLETWEGWDRSKYGSSDTWEYMDYIFEVSSLMFVCWDTLLGDFFLMNLVHILDRGFSDRSKNLSMVPRSIILGVKTFKWPSLCEMGSHLFRGYSDRSLFSRTKYVIDHRWMLKLVNGLCCVKWVHIYSEGIVIDHLWVLKLVNGLCCVKWVHIYSEGIVIDHVFPEQNMWSITVGC